MPGKVMNEICGKPMIGHLIDRLKLSKMIDKIVLASSHLSENDRLCAYVSGAGVDVYRGSEDDVLERYYHAAQKYAAETVVRITGDCPLIDPVICDRVIGRFVKSGLDYLTTGQTFAEGLDCEVLSFAALERSWHEARRGSEREHVTLFIRNHKELFKQTVLENEQDDSRYRIVVDEPEDFDVIRDIFEGLMKEGPADFRFEDIKRFLDENPAIKAKNAHILRNEGLLRSLQKEAA